MRFSRVVIVNKELDTALPFTLTDTLVGEHAHRPRKPPRNPPRTLGIGLRQGPREA